MSNWVANIIFGMPCLPTYYDDYRFLSKGEQPIRSRAIGPVFPRNDKIASGGSIVSPVFYENRAYRVQRTRFTGAACFQKLHNVERSSENRCPFSIRSEKRSSRFVLETDRYRTISRIRRKYSRLDLPRMQHGNVAAFSNKAMRFRIKRPFVGKRKKYDRRAQ